jgi:hypothetical protein
MDIVVAAYIESQCLRDQPSAVQQRLNEIEREYARRAAAAQKLTKWTEMEFVSVNCSRQCNITNISICFSLKMQMRILMMIG